MNQLAMLIQSKKKKDGLGNQGKWANLALISC